MRRKNGSLHDRLTETQEAVHRGKKELQLWGLGKDRLGLLSRKDRILMLSIGPQHRLRR
jgi:hypothetical protein